MVEGLGFETLEEVEEEGEEVVKYLRLRVLKLSRFVWKIIFDV
jgi:hypothetical protein